MPWKRLINGIKEIVGIPGTNGIDLDIDRVARIKNLLAKLGLSRLRAKDIADGYLALLPKRNRRSKGVYYTPNQVVEYILDEVLPRPKIGKNKQAPYPDGFRILEPACGTGYFLIASYSRFRDAYKQAGYKSSEAARIIFNQRIAGIDIDEDALLGCLAGLIQEAGNDLEQALGYGPVNVGLFRSDFLDKRYDSSDTRLGLILKSGIPAIVGNPPYVSFYAKRASCISERQKEYYKETYMMGRGRINTYCLFIERAFDLLDPSGTLGFIVPNTVLIMKSYEPLRQYLLEHGWLKSIVDLSLKVFPEVEVPTCILSVEKKDKRALQFPRSTRAGFWESARGRLPDDLEETDQKDFERLPYTMFNIHIRSGDRDILDAIERAGKPLGDQFEVRDGINPANMTEKLVTKSLDKLDPPYKPVLRGKDIFAYQLNWDNMWVRYDPHFADKLAGDYCFLREERIFIEKPKILTRQTADRIVAAWDDQGYYAMNTIHVTLPLNGGMDMKCLLALYNSRLLNYYYRLVFPDTERVFPQVKTINMEKLPLPMMNGETSRLSALVDRLIRTSSMNGESIRNREKILDEIDEVVYSLYGLAPKQIARIMRSTQVRTLQA